MTGRSPETAASRAIRAGRPDIATSFRFHRPRGPLCGRGYCGQCEITTPAGPVLACQVPPDHQAASPPPRRPVRVYEEIEADEAVVGAGGDRRGAFLAEPAQGDIVVGVYPGRILTLLRGDRMLSVRFERLVLDTGSYERLPPIPGNDLPGVVGLAAAERYGDAGGLRPALKVAVWAARDEYARARELAARHGAAIVWMDDVAPRAIAGERNVEAVITDRRIACDLFIVGVRQPAIELALQVGATAALTGEGLPVLALSETPPWLEVVGEAARAGSGVPSVEAADEAIVCPCRDVRVCDLTACVAQGFAHAELVKRRTGAMTGFCQGKLCAAAVLDVLRNQGVDPTPTRARPLAGPVALAELAANA
jgi:hypothetical protein